MAALLTALTGRSKAAAYGKPTHPGPRLPGSLRGPSSPTGHGTPIETASYSQSEASSRASSTMREGVSVGPEGALRGSTSPLSSTFIFAPPMSLARLFDGGLGRPDWLRGRVGGEVGGGVGEGGWVMGGGGRGGGGRGEGGGTRGRGRGVGRTRTKVIR